jgi:hypothetical protein
MQQKIIGNLFLFILVLCCQGVIYQFVKNVAMNRSIYNHAECFMRRFKLKISASGTCQNNNATLRLNIPFSGFSYGNSLYITFASRRTVT